MPSSPSPATLFTIKSAPLNAEIAEQSDEKVSARQMDVGVGDRQNNASDLRHEARHRRRIDVSAYRQKGLTLVNSPYALVAAAIAASVRASSRPVNNPAAKIRCGFDRRRMAIAVRRCSSTAMSLSSPRLSSPLASTIEKDRERNG